MNVISVRIRINHRRARDSIADQVHADHRPIESVVGADQERPVHHRGISIERCGSLGPGNAGGVENQVQRHRAIHLRAEPAGVCESVSEVLGQFHVLLFPDQWDRTALRYAAESKAMPPSNLVNASSLQSLGSYQSPFKCLSPNQCIISNTNAAIADGANLYSATIPTESANTAFDITAAGAKWVYERQRTMIDNLRFTLGHTADPNNKTALVRVVGWYPRLHGSEYQYEGVPLLSLTITCGDQADTNCLLVRQSLRNVAGKALLLKKANTITIGADYTRNANAKVWGNAANGHAVISFDPGSCPLVSVEAALTGGTAASCIVGEYAHM